MFGAVEMASHFISYLGEEASEDESSGASAIGSPVTDLLCPSGVLGSGTFGLVFKAKWCGQTVAVKRIHTEEARNALRKEIKILTTVVHENIVQLKTYKSDYSLLVMEYAEGGNLYDVLHNTNVHYSVFHAISWIHQTSKGVSHLHRLKLLHRDIKPPNLLLQDYCRKIKICDFGTACNVRTHMTSNQGSAMWMAPEVFSSSQYTEKCDVYSWAITFWEILSRQKPVSDPQITAYQILWAVATKDLRPRLFHSCPPFIEDLIVLCWQEKPDARPSMFQVEEVMESAVRLFNPPELARIELPSDNIDRVTDLQSDQGYSYEENVLTPCLTAGDTRRIERQSSVYSSEVDDAYSSDTFEDNYPPPAYQSAYIYLPLTSSTKSNRHSQLFGEKILASGYNVDQSLRPLKPHEGQDKSVFLYKQHCAKLADYIRLDLQCKLLANRKEELMQMQKMKKTCIPSYEKERESIESAISSLTVYYEDLMKQVDHFKMKKKAKEALKDGWIFL